MNGAQRQSRRTDRSERGASLILALVFIVVVAVIVGAISSLALNDLNNTTHFNSAVALDYSASSVAALAIQGVRYAPQTVDGALGTGPCWITLASPNISEQTFNGQTVAIWCTSVHHAGSSQSRDVTMIACASALPSTATSAQSSAAEVNCATNPLLTLVEAYDDYSAAGTDLCVGAQPTCGSGASTLVWKWGSLGTVTGGLILNTIAVTPSSPPSPTVNGSFTPTVSSTSGDIVTIDSETPTVCTVSGGVVSFVTAGICTLSYTDPGNFNYAPAAPYLQTFTIN
jgi:hypothetical protein